MFARFAAKVQTWDRADIAILAFVALLIVGAGVCFYFMAQATTDASCSYQYGYGLRMDGKYGWGQILKCE